MIVQNLFIILRRFSRQKLHTTLHIAGLTLGMSVCLLIALFLRYELSFDHYHAKADRIYRVNVVVNDRGDEVFHYSSPAPLANALRREVPELEQVARVQPDRSCVIELNPQKRFEQPDVLLAEPALLDIFDIEVLRGNGHEALRQPFQALLTESTAEKFFGREDPIGKTFKCKNQYVFTVAGIVRDQPGNTHLPFTMLLSFAENIRFPGCDTSPGSWSSMSGGSTYCILPANFTPENLSARVQSIYDRDINTMSDMPSWVRFNAAVQPLKSIHLEPKWAGGSVPMVKPVSTTWLWFFAGIGLAVLALACVNFVNLSTAQAIKRSKEVGVRKSIGARRGQLIRQFLGESLLLASVSGALAMIVTAFSLPALNELLEKKITFDPLNSPALPAALALGIVLTSLLAGLYPAWVIARFRPAVALKSNSAGSEQSAAGLRKGLVVTQFTLSVGLLTALIIMGQQMQLFRHKNLGFDHDNTIMVSVPDSDKSALMAAEMNKISAIRDITFFSSPPSSDEHWGSVMSLGGEKDPSAKDVTLIWGDEHYGRLFNLQLLAGRLNEASDTAQLSHAGPDGKTKPYVVVNRKFVQEMGFGTPEEAVGKRFWVGVRNYWPEIVGVVEDFNTSSLHERIKATMLMSIPEFQDQAGIKIAANSDMPKTLAAIGSSWAGIFPQELFQSEFLDENIQSSYRAEERLFSLFQIFAMLAMLISCLGLFGLVTFSAEQRVKEIGIRKVLGASVAGIANLLVGEFMKLVLIAFLIASPVAYYFMQNWLADFAYRIDIQWWMFGMAGASAIGIALLTVSFQSVRAALANPVKSLRSE